MSKKRNFGKYNNPHKTQFDSIYYAPSQWQQITSLLLIDIRAAERDQKLTTEYGWMYDAIRTISEAVADAGALNNDGTLPVILESSIARRIKRAYDVEPMVKPKRKLDPAIKAAADRLRKEMELEQAT